MKNFDQTKFVNDLGVDWGCIVRKTDDVNVAVSKWAEVFSFILERLAPGVFLTNTVHG